MPNRFVERKKRNHGFKPLEKKELRCALVSQKKLGEQNEQLTFQQEVNDWIKKWDLTETITYALVKGSEDIEENSREERAMYFALSTWQREIPLKLQFVKPHQNPKIKIEFTNSKNDTYFSDNPGALAYAWYPGTSRQGIIKFNDDYNWVLDGKIQEDVGSHNLASTLIHEMGHCLGLTHSIGKENKDTVMYPAYNGSLRLSQPDIDRIKEFYKTETTWSSLQEYQKIGDDIYSQIKNL